ncbi:MAG: bifunctional phosphopantothenoylcysteine decarboxylase/phosphopantothenate--cysteine ligase CoaBC [Woeseiaceae bacterium]|nr:bifunctional phosphopantothenoylcysteine decarboxylase/phosphopantothenate--cysteine ligase CoaBC [Woeseiaceae bacterium]
MAISRIILGVTGGIAAYKTPALVRRLKDRGVEVQVVLTRSAREFVTETTLQAVSGLPVRDNLWDKETEAAMGHIELARWADLVLIAPATAEIMSRLASGSAPDLLTTLCLATEARIAIAPAMNHVMWVKDAVQENRRRLEERGVHILGPDDGDQACGETGPGRMVSPDDIVASLLGPAAAHPVLSGKSILITAGPTYEAIDPVRYITNRSSGKMGYALAAACQEAGADVLLVSGPVSISPPVGVKVLPVQSAADMHAAVHAHLDGADIFVGAAAVSDYRVADISRDKIKKSGDDLSIALAQNADILASVAALSDGPFTVGFAAETTHLREHALAKLEKKKADMIVANLVGKDLGFDTDDNAVDVYWKGGEQSFSKRDKAMLARDLTTLIVERHLEHSHTAMTAELPATMVRD